MATIRITKAQRNSDIIALLTGNPVQYGTSIEDAVAHLTHENEMLSRKNKSESRKPTKTQKENEELRARILDYLNEQDTPVTASDVMSTLELGSTQKASALLNGLAAEGKVIKEKIKGKSVFSTAA